MNAIVIEHVKIDDLPADWRARLAAAPDARGAERVTVRIEAENGPEAQSTAPVADDPLFGMWRDREDMADVPSYIRSLRAPRPIDDVPPRKV